MKIQTLLLLLPGWGAASSNDVHRSEIKEIEVDPTCTSADGLCLKDDIAKEVGMGGSATAASEKVAEICEDKHDSCSSWASSGECEANPKYMLKYCRLSCDGSCVNQDALVKEAEKVANTTTTTAVKDDEPAEVVCKDDNESCAAWADKGECEANPKYMLKHCHLSCEVCFIPEKVYSPEELEEGVDLGVAQTVESKPYGITKEQVAERLEKARNYVKSDEVKALSKDLKEICRNEHELCTVWAIYGECEKYEKYMHMNCAPVCQSCNKLTIAGRCPMDPDAPEAWGPGDLDKMFLKLTAEPYLSEYNVQIYSSPFDEEGGPWLITLDNVVKEEEAERLIELGAVEEYTRSTDVGKLKADGTAERKVSEGRTSTNAWCKGPCYEDEMAQRVIHRLSELTGIDERNSEYLQLLRYEEGQYYNNHHDYIPHHIERQQGVRILTFYLYLSDVEEGGGTNFDKVKNTTVTPKRGRAVLWPSVMNDDPNAKDGRTTHQAMPVIKGIKYGANAWFHLRDFKTPHHNLCI